MHGSGFAMREMGHGFMNNGYHGGMGLIPFVCHLIFLEFNQRKQDLLSDPPAVKR